MPRKPQSQYDAIWKEALRVYFPDFCAFFMPEAYADIDWSRRFEFLDEELIQVARRAKIGRLAVDKLVKVWRKDGEETWVLIHVEVQSQPEPEFERRVFLYSAELLRIYKRMVCSFIVLADAQGNWRPHAFGYQLWGCSHAFHFPTVKLIDYRVRWSELEASQNPFAVVVMAHLKSQETAPDSRDRLLARLQLFRLLRRSGRSREQAASLLEFIEGLLVMTDALESELFELEVQEEEEDPTVKLTTYAERVGHKRGFEEGKKEGREEGEKEGMEQGMRAAIETFLRNNGREFLLPDVAKLHGTERLQAFLQRLGAGATSDELRQFCLEHGNGVSHSR